MRVNPAGIVFRFRSFRTVQNVTSIGAFSSEFTWFEGCDWQIIVCEQCHLHVGWHFAGRMRFTALLNARTVESGG